MQTRDVIVTDPYGMHMRVAAQIVAVVKAHRSTVRLSCSECRHASGCSILQLMLLGAAQGQPVHLQIEGPDEQRVADRLCDVFADGGGI